MLKIFAYLDLCCLVYSADIKGPQLFEAVYPNRREGPPTYRESLRAYERHRPRGSYQDQNLGSESPQTDHKEN